MQTNAKYRELYNSNIKYPAIYLHCIVYLIVIIGSVGLDMNHLHHYFDNIPVPLHVLQFQANCSRCNLQNYRILSNRNLSSLMNSKNVIVAFQRNNRCCNRLFCPIFRINCPSGFDSLSPVCGNPRWKHLVAQKVLLAL